MSRLSTIARLVAALASLGSLAALSAARADDAAPLTLRDLTDLRARVVADTDQFAAPVDQRRFIGRRFRVEVDPSVFRTDIPWSYDRDTQRLTVTFQQGELLGDFPGRCSAIGAVVYRATAATVKTGQTAGGAVADYNSYRDDDLSLGSLSCTPRPYTPPFGLSVTLSLPGDQARARAQSLRFVIEGETVDLGGGRVIECGIAGSGATLRNPSELFIKNCVVGAHISKIAAYDSTGEIGEWP